MIRLGFANIQILDFDKVEASNISRQITYFKEDIGKYKVDVLKEYAKRINPKANIDTLKIEIKEEKDLEKNIKDVDFIISTVDKPRLLIRRIINNVAVKKEVPLIFGGFSEYTSIIGPFIIPKKTACISCLEKINHDYLKEEFLDNVPVTPSFITVCGIVGNLITVEVVNYFVKFKKNNLQGKVLLFNNYSYNVKIEEIKKVSKCEICGGHNGT